MTRTWLRYSPPAAFLAGALLVHCSSSSTPSTGGSTDAGGTGTTGASHATTSGGSVSTSGAVTTMMGTIVSTVGTPMGSSPPSSSGPNSATLGTSGTTAGSSASSGSAASCPGGPVGGAPCNPGFVSCGTECAVPANECCVPNGDAGSMCLPAASTCSGNKVECDEKADCAEGQICCLDTTNLISGAFTISCQTSCGSGLGKAQVCTTNAECPGGTCSIYSCEGNITQACSSPAASFCSKVGEVIMGVP